MRHLQDGRCRAVDKSASFAVNPPDLRFRGEQECISLVLCETPLTRNFLGQHFDIRFLERRAFVGRQFKASEFADRTRIVVCQPAPVGRSPALRQASGGRGAAGDGGFPRFQVHQELARDE